MITASPRQRVAGLFPHPTTPWSRAVGIEQELVAADARDGSVVSVDRLRAVTADRPYSRWLTFEPGGQVELSLPCAPSVDVLEHRYGARIRELRQDCAAAGIVLEAAPVDPRGSAVPLQLRTPRYRAMIEHFDRIGPAGRRMMLLTTSTQLCLDWSAGRTGLEQWTLAHLSAPFLAAVFARATGPGSRLATWLEVDPSRTAFDGRLLAGDPVAAYADFATGAIPFTAPGEHLSTLFPPVRPRGRYLEVRYLDSQPDDAVISIASLLSTLLHDDGVRREALRRVAGEAARLDGHWHDAARGRAHVADRGRELIDLVRSHELADAA